jgi:hypothetical protein
LCFASGEGTSSTHTTSLTLTHPTPNTELFTVPKREFETIVFHNAASTHFFGFFCRSTTLREKQIRVHTHAIRSALPTAIFREQLHQIIHRWEPPPALPSWKLRLNGTPLLTASIRTAITTL